MSESSKCTICLLFSLSVFHNFLQDFKPPFFRATNTFSHILLDGVEPRREDGLHLCPGHGNEGGRDLADVGDDGEREGDPDDGEDDAEHAPADSLGGDVAIAYK